MKIETLKKKKLSLTNDGRLELFFIGAGSAFTKRQYQTNLLIIKGKDHVLIDCGTKCPQALSELGVPVTDISNFLITHSHADHIGGLEEVCLMGRYVTKKKPLMIVNETYQYILWDMSLRGGCAYNEEEARDMLSFSDFWTIKRPIWLPDYPRETFKVDIGEINIKMMRTKHIPDSSSDWQSSFWSCGVIIDDRIMFTSDTRYDHDLVEFYETRFDFEAIFHDCQFFTGGVHAGIEELKQFSPEIKKKMYLTHYGDNWEDFEDKVKEYGFAGLTQQQVFYVFD
ncbi:MAG: MBL fold metallo-hydrolase [Spirochaetes bacterium]|nr:MBL fold metallo-hydrolase [Spirochaetota bacterium]